MALGKMQVSVLYLSSPEQDGAVESTLRTLRNCKVSTLLVYTPHHSSDFAFRVGTIVGRQKFDEAEWVFNWPHLRQLLKARNIRAHAGRTVGEQEPFGLLEARQRLGLSQEQLATALNVTARTLQNCRQAGVLVRCTKRPEISGNCSPVWTTMSSHQKRRSGYRRRLRHSRDVPHRS